MVRKATIQCILMMVLLGVINAQDALPLSFPALPSFDLPEEPFTDLSKPLPNTNPIRLFTNAFTKSVKSSPKLLKVFDVSVPSFQVSKQLFQTYRDALKNVGSNYPASLAKTLADAVYLTLPFISQDTYIYVIGRSMAEYILSQEILTVANAATLAQQFSSAIQKNIPPGNVNSLALVGALSNGIVNFLKGHGPIVLKRSSVFTISAADHFYAFSVISKPQVGISVVNPSGSLEDAAKAYGVKQFTATFVKAVDASKALQSVFYTAPVSDVGQAWQTAMNVFCKSIKCNPANQVNAKTVLSDTYLYMSKYTYTKDISNAYALILIELGRLNFNNVDLQAKTVAKLIENFVAKLPANADLATRLGTIFSALRALMLPKSNILNQFSAFTSHITIGFYSDTPVFAHASVI